MTAKRPLKVLVADTDAYQGISALLRPGSRFRRRLGLTDFLFDTAKDGPTADMIESELGDGDVHVNAPEILRRYTSTHERALVFLDQQFGGERPAAQIYAEIHGDLVKDWDPAAVEVIVFEPEVEAWLWQRDNPHIATLFGFEAGRHGTTVDAVLGDRGIWPTDEPKPRDPKRATEVMRQLCRTRWSSKKFAQIANEISDKGCTDPAYLRFKETMLRWFGPTAVSVDQTP